MELKQFCNKNALSRPTSDIRANILNSIIKDSENKRCQRKWMPSLPHKGSAATTNENDTLVQDRTRFFLIEVAYEKV